MASSSCLPSLPYVLTSRLSLLSSFQIGDFRMAMEQQIFEQLDVLDYRAREEESSASIPSRAVNSSQLPNWRSDAVTSDHGRLTDAQGYTGRNEPPDRSLYINTFSPFPSSRRSRYVADID
nr:hypothetical protein CFP56_00357 [Quercus suber]